MFSQEEVSVIIFLAENIFVPGEQEQIRFCNGNKHFDGQCLLRTRVRLQLCFVMLC